MYKIGEFANMTGLSIRTLRYYDSIDLLKPGHVDRYSGYRYYTDENLYEVYIINLLKNTNFSLNEIILYKDQLDEEIINNKIMELEEEKNSIDDKISTLNAMKQEVKSKSKEDVKVLKLVRNEKKVA